jgi:DNA-binding response OmpR family regulator
VADAIRGGLGPEGPDPSDRPVVLVADDDQAVRSFFQSALSRAGFNVLLATTGRGAIEIARSRPVDVLILDLNMPDLGGLGTLRELRADPLLRALPVIIATGSADEADRLAGLDQGADDVLVKPVPLAELVARVRAQIRIGL